MNDYINELIRKHRCTGILLDTNILLLYFVGAVDPERINTFKRTYSQGFSMEDYFILVNLLDQFEQAITTPNILTEVSNFLGQLPQNLHTQYFNTFANGIRTLNEHYITSSDAFQRLELQPFGLTDAGIIETAKDNFLLLTEDFKLSQCAHYAGVDTLNFNHIKSLPLS